MKARINGITLSINDQGTGLPIIFLHAFPLNHTLWAEQEEALSSQFRVITIDLRGHGDFAINELPDLQPRIQVGLFNILEEKDIQSRGFNIRIPLDVMLVFTANPEDYTNRGNIITPLKDRIASQILTHYPQSVAEAIRITDQEAWTERGIEFHMPGYFREIVEQVAFEARRSEFVDQSSGVSARVSIAAYENLLSNMERRASRSASSPSTRASSTCRPWCRRSPARSSWCTRASSKAPTRWRVTSSVKR